MGINLRKRPESRKPKQVDADIVRVEPKRPFAEGGIVDYNGSAPITIHSDEMVLSERQQEDLTNLIQPRLRDLIARDYNGAQMRTQITGTAQDLVWHNSDTNEFERQPVTYTLDNIEFNIQSYENEYPTMDTTIAIRANIPSRRDIETYGYSHVIRSYETYENNENEVLQISRIVRSGIEQVISMYENRVDLNYTDTDIDMKTTYLVREILQTRR